MRGSGQVMKVYFSTSEDLFGVSLNNAFQSLGFIENAIGINWTQLPNKATKHHLIRVQANAPHVFRKAFGLIYPTEDVNRLHRWIPAELIKKFNHISALRTWGWMCILDGDWSRSRQLTYSS
jgi:hypothetical protein